MKSQLLKTSLLSVALPLGTSIFAAASEASLRA